MLPIHLYEDKFQWNYENGVSHEFVNNNIIIHLEILFCVLFQLLFIYMFWKLLQYFFLSICHHKLQN